MNLNRILLLNPLISYLVTEMDLELGEFRFY